MKTRIAKWGNSFALRLPKHIVDEMELSDDSDLIIQSRPNGFVVMRPAKEAKLAALLKDLQPQKEVDWGAARGKEVW